MTIAASAFVVACVLGELWRAARTRHALGDVSWVGATTQPVMRNRRRYGGYLVHIGVAVLALGIALSANQSVTGTIDQRLAAQRDLVQAAEKTYRLSDARYRKGVDNYLGVLDAQRFLYGTQQGLVALKRARLINQVQLYAALGGGVR